MFSFLNAAFLAALPLAAVPVLIHLFHRRRRVRIAWGAMHFLNAALTRRRRLWRLADVLLMILRLAAVAAIVLALAQPLFKTKALASGAPRDVIVILDTSLSMAENAGQQSLFQRALTRADELIQRLSAHDALRVLLAGPVPEWLTPGWVEANEAAKKEVRAQIRLLSPTLGCADLLACFNSALEVEPADRQAVRLIAVLSDDQTLSWQPQQIDGWKSLAEKIKALPYAVAINSMNLADAVPAPATISVESITANRSVTGPGEPLVLTAQARNTGAAPTAPMMLQWRDGEEAFGTSPLQGLQPGQSATVNIEHAFAAAGVCEVSCEAIGSDDLPLDNKASLAVQVSGELPVLVVDGAPQIAAPINGTGCLLAALGYAPGQSTAPTGGAWHAIFRPKVIDLNGLGPEELGDYGAIVLVNTLIPDGEMLGKLADFVKKGGGLWLALGDQIDPALFNQAFFNQAQGLAPLALAAPTGDAANHDKAEAIHPAAAQHSATRLLADAQKLDLDRVRIYRRHQFATTRSDARVNVLLSTGSGAPLAVERALGRGRVIVQAIPLGADWSNLPLNQAFVVWMNEWLWYLAEPSVPNWNLNLGETLEASFPAGLWHANARAINPQRHAFAITGEPRGKQTAYLFSRTLWPGSWQLELTDKDKKKVAVPFEVQRNLKESELTRVTQQQKKALAAASGIEFTTDPLAERPGAGRAPRPEPVWPLLLMILIALLMLEPLIAGMLTRNRMMGMPTIRMPIDQAGE